MKCNILFPFIILVVGICSWAEDISLKGMVKDDKGAGIEGAKLQLAKLPHISGTSSKDGSFIVMGDSITPIITPMQKSLPAFNVSITPKNIVFTTHTFKHKLSLSMFNCAGRVIFSHIFLKLAAGSHSISLAHTPLIPGLYILQIRDNGHILQTNKLSIIAQYSTMTTQTTHLSPKNVATFNEASHHNAVVIDTLIVTSKNHKHKRILIDNYQTNDIACALDKSNQWQPDKPLEHEKGMVKIYAKGYDFEMGQPNPNLAGPGKSKRELPMHTVSFTYDYWMDTTEVTQIQYETLMKKQYDTFEKPWWNESIGEGSEYPCYLIKVADAMLFCNAKSKEEGLDTVYTYESITGPLGHLCQLVNEKIDVNKNGYRLPYEAEWEYASRGGKGTDYYWDKNFLPYPSSKNDTNEINSYCFWSANASDLEGTLEYGSHKVASKKPNAYGLYDMSGNLSEYCNDFDDVYPFKFEAVDPFGPEKGVERILRGGNWSSKAAYLRCTNRYFLSSDYPYYFTGFRTVRPIK